MTPKVPKRSLEDTTPIHNGSGEDGLREIVKNLHNSKDDYLTKLDYAIPAIREYIESEKQALLAELLEKLPEPYSDGTVKFYKAKKDKYYMEGYNRARTEVEQVIQRMMGD